MTAAPSLTLRDLVLLDALSETTQEQKKQLAAALEADSRLAGEHAETLAIVSKLAIPANSIPPMPSRVLTTLEQVQTGPDRTKSFPLRFVWAAAAAILFAGWWLPQTEWTPPSPEVVQAPNVIADSEALPAQGAAFEFKMGAPFGNEILMAVASSVPFTDQAGQDVQTQLFQEFKDTNLESLAHRGISVEEKKVLTGRALHHYRVEAKK